MSEPIAERPDMASYGVPEDLDGVMAWSWARDRLVPNRNYWVVTADASARPHAMPVWGVWRPDANDFWFSCAPDARKARNLAANPQITVTTDHTVEVVSVEGRAELVHDGADRAGVVDAYVEKYAGEMVGADELREFISPTAFYRVVPERAFGVIEEPDRFGPAATRWRWDR